MRRTLLAVAGICTATVTWASVVEFTYENFHRTPTGAVEVVLKFTNKTSRTLTLIRAECALLAKDKRALTVIPVNVQSVRPGQAAYGKNYGPRDLPVEHADCRIVDYD